MKSLYIVLVLFITLNSWGGVRRLVTEEDIGTLPFVAFIDENEDQITYRVYFYDIASFRGLAGITLMITDETASRISFYGPIDLFDHIEQGVKFSEFILRENMVCRATLEISVSQKTTSYQIPISLIHKHFKDNISSGLLTTGDLDPAINEVLKKKFQLKNWKPEAEEETEKPGKEGKA
jgi:hypothetical protein